MAEAEATAAVVIPAAADAHGKLNKSNVICATNIENSRSRTALTALTRTPHCSIENLLFVFSSKYQYYLRQQAHITLYLTIRHCICQNYIPLVYRRTNFDKNLRYRDALCQSQCCRLLHNCRNKLYNKSVTNRRNGVGGLQLTDM